MEACDHKATRNVPCLARPALLHGDLRETVDPRASPCGQHMYWHTGREAHGPVQVGAATGVHAEALRLVDRLRARLRAVATQVAKQPQRLRVLSLEGLKPLCLGDPPSLGRLCSAGRTRQGCLLEVPSCSFSKTCRELWRRLPVPYARCVRFGALHSLRGDLAGAGGLWLSEMKELAGGECDWQQGGDAPLRITWDQVMLHDACSADGHREAAAASWLSNERGSYGAAGPCAGAGPLFSKQVHLQVREYEPEVLILSPCSCNPSRTLSEVTSLAGLPGWWALPAVKSGQVYIVDHAYFSRPGPRYSTRCSPSLWWTLVCAWQGL